MSKPEVLNSGIVSVTFGEGVRIVQPVNLYDCILSDNVFIGPFVEVQSDVVVGRNTKIQSHSFVCSKVTIGEDCFIGHGVMFINDVFSDGGPARGDKSKWKKTTIGDKVSIGSNATIMPVSICSDVVIAAGAVVIKDIDEAGTYVGVPARRVEKGKTIS